jgi:hypothetical protein
MTLPQKLFGDPLDVLIRVEEETCRGCRFRTVDRDGNAHCRNPRVDQVLAEQRCDEYQENS